MRLKHTKPAQDAILSDCQDFGGKAAEAAEVAEELDNSLTEALDKITELEKQVSKLEERA